MKKLHLLQIVELTATYQRLVNRMFSEQLGKTREVYIDDMLAISLHAEDHVSHLEECFARLNLHNMKLNPGKCRFAVASGKCRFAEANPKTSGKNRD